jgi:hypothetical protein
MVRHKVFGLGLSKTGTTSLAAALNILDIKTIHCPRDEKTISELKRGVYKLAVLNEYDGAVDIPIAPYYAQLDLAYPSSKFILTVRDKTAWLRSTEDHWKRATRARNVEIHRFREFIRPVVYGTVEFDPDRFSCVYDTHEQNVRRYFQDRPDDLLILDICGGDGWEKLCGFLGLSLPQIPFPHKKKNKDSYRALPRNPLSNTTSS